MHFHSINSHTPFTLAVGAAGEGSDEEEEAPKEHQLQKLIKMGVDNPSRILGGAKKLGQAQMSSKRALARVRQLRLKEGK